MSRYLAEGDAGLLDRSSAAHDVHNRTPEDRIGVICALRRLRMTGAEIAEILTRSGLGRLGRLGMEPAQRYERSRPSLATASASKAGDPLEGAQSSSQLPLAT